MSHEVYPSSRLGLAQINKLGHIISVGAAIESQNDFNLKIEVFSVAQEGDRAQIYQMWAIDKIVSNPVVLDAFEKFGLAGDSKLAKDKEKWTQLVEHIAGVAAIAEHIFTMMHEHGGVAVDLQVIDTAAMLDNIDKRAAVEAVIAEQKEKLGTSTSVHDLEKPAELAAGAGGLENSRDNPVLREGRLWAYLHEQGVGDDIILAAQNTGRSDRFFSNANDYDEKTLTKAIEDRQTLARLMGVEMEVIENMTPDERRATSIALKGLRAAIVGGSDAQAKQFKFQGMKDADIDAMAEHYLTYKTDPESKVFFNLDWRAYYKINRQYLIDQVPEENRAAFTAELDTLTHEKIFNQTILPSVLGPVGNSKAHQRLKYPEKDN